MARGDREKFLAEPRVGTLAVTDDRNPGAPLQVPLWYSFAPGGEVVVLTPHASVKAGLIRRAGRFGLCVQDETPPYRYVSVEGPVVQIGESVDPAEWEAMAHRYLDPVTAEAYLVANRNQLDDHMTFRMRPERWRAADFSVFAKQFS